MLIFVDTFLFWVNIGQSNTSQRAAYSYNVSSTLTFINETGCVVCEVRADHARIAVERKDYGTRRLRDVCCGLSHSAPQL